MGVGGCPLLPLPLLLMLLLLQWRPWWRQFFRPLLLRGIRLDYLLLLPLVAI